MGPGEPVRSKQARCDLAAEPLGPETSTELQWLDGETFEGDPDRGWLGAPTNVGQPMRVGANLDSVAVRLREIVNARRESIVIGRTGRRLVQLSLRLSPLREEYCRAGLILVLHVRVLNRSGGRPPS